MKSENKKIVIILIVIAAIVGLLVLLGVQEGMKSKKTYEKFEEAFTKEEPTLLYIGKTSCQYCQLLDPSLQEMQTRYGFEAIHINIDKFNSSYFNKVASKLELSEIATPYLLVINKDGIVAKQSGYMDYDKLFEFLQKNNVIDKDAKLLLDYINYDQYAKLLASSEPSIIVVGQSTCHYCIEAKLVLNQIVEENKIAIHYLNIGYLNEEEAKKFQNSLEYFGKEGWGTPVTFIAKDGKMVKTLEGYNTKEKFVQFFKEQGVL